ncbi:MAG: hypothetical protein F6K45_19345 [Kamptonema sp. SIO1D9]|nr:hypothetical protein [Kamptonema sp. SIO1D9]
MLPLGIVLTYARSAIVPNSRSPFTLQLPKLKMTKAKFANISIIPEKEK